MRIYTNIAALRSNLHLDTADNKSSKSIERLSSGYKINRAEDDPVGRAISNKMKMQIKSLERANQNAADGVSIVQTAEGALGEIHDMLGRMSELAVQAANDIYTEEDKQSIQDEVDELLEEINRIARDTDFNGRTLLDGSLSRKAFAEDIIGIEQLYTTDSVAQGRYGIIVTGEPQKATYSTSGMQGGFITEELSGIVKFNSISIKIEEGDTKEDIYSKFREASYAADIDMTINTAGGNETLSFTQSYYGSNKTIEISCENEDLANFLGIDTEVVTAGLDTEVATIVTKNGFSSTATVESDGEKVTFKDKGGFEMMIKINAGTYTNNMNMNGEMRVAYNVTGAGSMTIQIGSNQGQIVDIDIPRISTDTLGIDDLSMKTTAGAQRAINQIQGAIGRVSSVRSYVGAYQNRLEATISSLGVTNENMNSSLSRIEDVDMALEMTEYTTQNVLAQAATSMLAQANQMPEKVLQLLQ